MPIHDISRREFLKLAGAGLLSCVLAELGIAPALAQETPFQGRVLYTSLIVRDKPAFTGARVNSFKRDNIIDLAGKVFGGADGDYNRTWFRLQNGSYVYSGGVQPVVTGLNQKVESLAEGGMVAEITVPYADTLWAVNRSPSPGPRLYYASTHWITDIVRDERDGSFWYKAYDNLYDSHYYIPPEWVRIIPQEELNPLSPQVPGHEKHVEIHLDRQLLLAFEWNVPVYAARVATGQRNYESPTGWFMSFHKRPSYHMTGGADEFSVFDLPGVPWNSYITESGVAIHGTYWHNDFGHPHSHGCINMHPEDARWIYRWTLPSVPTGERLVLKPGQGTRVWIT